MKKKKNRGERVTNKRSRKVVKEKRNMEEIEKATAILHS